ncbi:MAG: hypothetical protein JXR68_03090 [Bacteroidales bacterium]|nr:hypothetical protein [Bacteroidales bacterium]
MTTKRKKSFNTIVTGLIPGFILPIVSIYIFYLFQNSFSGSFETYINQVIEYRAITKVLSVCMLANLGLFFLFIQTLRYKSARGVLFATILYAIAMVLYMFIF